MNSPPRQFMLPLLALTLSACFGGGSSDYTAGTGGGGGNTNQAPVAEAGADRSVDEGDGVALNGIGTDAEDGSNLGYAWTQLSGPAALNPGSPASPNLAFTAPQVTQQSVMVFQLRVTDHGGLSDTDSVAVTVRDVGGNGGGGGGGGGNTPPTADAGGDQTATQGATAALDGSESNDAEDGHTLSFAWSQTGGPAVTLNDAHSAIASFSAPDVSVPTPLSFRLIVTDGSGASATDETSVTVLPPAAAHGAVEAACLANGAPAEFCAALGALQSGIPDRIVLASDATPRGSLLTEAQPARAPSVKTVDGNLSDWIGTPTRLGGTQRFDAGELIYSDYLFDAWGADDGGDAQRLQLLDPLAEVEPRTYRLDQLFQAAGDQFDAPRPAGAPDHYGDRTDLGSEADLDELRWAANAQQVYLLARFTTLTDADKPGLLVLLDTGPGPASSMPVGFDSGLRTNVFDTALLVTRDGVRQRRIATGIVTAVTAPVAVNAAGWTNALEAALPASLFPGTARVAVIAGPRTPDGLRPANVAYRFHEPVAGVYNDKTQALSLLDGNVDALATSLQLAALRGGVTESFAPGPGYFERQFISGGNISREQGEDGLLQPYGLYVPQAYSGSSPGRMTVWLHYRGGKTHSGAAWTPRLITELGEEQDNVVITPRGRGTSTWYTTQAHQDVFEAMTDVAGSMLVGDRLPGLGPQPGLLNIDPDHVALSGYSMGGYGTYLFGLLYPDLFAAGFTQSGAITQGLWTGVGPDEAVCETEQAPIPGLGDANLCFGEANDSSANAQLNYRLLENARHFPIVINHGTNDELVPITGIQRAALRMAELGYRYDMTMLLGYEHYTQAIVDEWADGAAYLNEFARPLNPRQVTYKVVPALVHALNTIQANGKGPFAFNPDGAYWVDGLTVRDADADDPKVSGMIDAESFAIAAPQVLPVPRTGDVSPPRISTPLFSIAGHSTPYIRHGLDWLTIGQLPTANGFRANLTRLSAASLDVARMNLDLTRLVSGNAITDSAATLTLTQVNSPVRVFVNGIERSGAIQNNRISIPLAPGASLVFLVPEGVAIPPTSEVGPSLAAACRSFGVQADPVCDIVDAVTAQLVGGCATLAPAGFCSTFGGNLQGIIEGCRTVGATQAALFCKTAEQLLLGAASFCRSSGLVPADFCALLSGEVIAEREVAAYEAGWTARALALQRQLGDGLPFHNAEFPSTHNSFNWTTANFPQTLSGSDPNQKYSLVDQLRMGMRAIELDVHWWFSTQAGPETAFRAPLLCHGNVNHVGCTTERLFRDGLVEVRQWLDAHPEEVIILYVEEHLDEPIDDTSISFDVTAGVIESILGTASAGDLIYRPAQHGASCNDDAPITNPTSWINVTREQIRAAHRQVLIFTGSCGVGSAWPALVHNKKSPHYVETSADSYEGYAYPSCMTPVEHAYSPQEFAAKFTRIYEDSTLLSAAVDGVGVPILAANVVEMMKCGINMPGFDQLTPSDPRLPALVWSWESGQPSVDAARNCAFSTADGRFRAAGCADALRYACRTSEGAWLIGGPAGAWQDGASACAIAGATFAVPRSGNDNEHLKEAKAAANATAVWLNYNDRTQEGEWVAAP